MVTGTGVEWGERRHFDHRVHSFIQSRWKTLEDRQMKRSVDEHVLCTTECLQFAVMYSVCKNVLILCWKFLSLPLRGDGYVYGVSVVMMSWVYASNLSGCMIKIVQVFWYVNRISVWKVNFSKKQGTIEIERTDLLWGVSFLGGFISPLASLRKTVGR